MQDADVGRGTVKFESAREHLTRKVPVALPTATAGEVRSALAGKAFEYAGAIAVCRDGVLAGILTLEKLLSAPASARVEELMDPDPPLVGPETDQEVAAWKAVQHGESTLSVVDGSGRFLGFVPPQRLLSVLLEEHHEDMARLSGMLRGALPARTALEEPVFKRFAHRLPWLVAGLAGAIAAADLVSSFESDIRRNVLLAFFLPGVVYLADAVGTQTETLVIRGLSVGIPIGRVVIQEAAAGLLIGIGLAALSFPLSILRWGQLEISIVLALSLVAACSVAAIVAVGLPWAFHRMRKDPAFGSGPLGTIIQDFLSIAIYLGMARLLLP
jgi:magnesium transporter